MDRETRKMREQQGEKRKKTIEKLAIDKVKQDEKKAVCFHYENNMQRI